MLISKVDVRLPGIEGRGRSMSAQTRHHFTTLRQINQLIEASAAEPNLGFMARLLALCSLPRTNQRDRLQYERSNGPYKLCMIAGSGKKLPFGNVPRLLLAWVCSEAVRTQSRELILGDSLAESSIRRRERRIQRRECAVLGTGRPPYRAARPSP